MLLFLSYNHSFGGISLIRDTEIENAIRVFSLPLLNAADIDYTSLKIRIVKSSEINAFVTRGQRLFITTGLLKKAKAPEQILGVIAHEVGHIMGGHLARLNIAHDNYRKKQFISQLFGVAIGAITKDPAATGAIFSGGKQIFKRKFISYNRSQEQMADQAAVRLLDQAKISSQGKLKFLRSLAINNLLETETQFPYLKTHPLTRERIRFVENHISRSTISYKPLHPKFYEKYNRIIAKLDGFLDLPSKTYNKYPAKERSIPGLYARTIAKYMEGFLETAILMGKKLTSLEPQNPYFLELQAQMLFENGQIENAMNLFQKCIKILTNAPLFRLGFAHAALGLNDRESVKSALAHLKESLRMDPSLPLAWKLTANAYNKLGENGYSALATAEYNLLKGQRGRANSQARRSLRILKPGSPQWLRAQDIKNETSRLK